jgi:hypothetical protein
MIEKEKLRTRRKTGGSKGRLNPGCWGLYENFVWYIYMRCVPTQTKLDSYLHSTSYYKPAVEIENTFV